MLNRPSGIARIPNLSKNLIRIFSGIDRPQLVENRFQQFRIIATIPCKSRHPTRLHEIRMVIDDIGMK